MSLVLPSLDQIAPGKKIKSSVLLAIFNTISGRFSYGITGADVDPNAAIPGSAILARSLAADRIIAGALTSTELGPNCVGLTQIQDAIITKAKLATGAGSKITKAQLELSTFTATASFASLITGVNIGLSYVPRVEQATVSGVNSWIVKVRANWRNSVTPDSTSGGDVTLTPASPIPVASTTPIGLYLQNATFAVGGGSVDAYLTYVNNT